MRYAACSEDHSTCLSTACEAFSAQAFSKNCLDIFIAKSCGTRHLQGLTTRSGSSFNSNLKSRAEEEIHKEEGLHVANTLIITLSLHVCSSCFHKCVYQKQSTNQQDVEGSAVDLSQAPTVENFGSDNPFAYAAYALYLLYEYVLSLFLIPARPCPVMLWHLCDASAARFPLHFFASQRYVQIKDQGCVSPI